MKPACKDCRFFEIGSSRPVDGPLPEIGSCRRYPGLGENSTQPIMGFYQWCGEFKKKRTK